MRRLGWALTAASGGAAVRGCRGHGHRNREDQPWAPTGVICSRVPETPTPVVQPPQQLSTPVPSLIGWMSGRNTLDTSPDSPVLSNSHSGSLSTEAKKEGRSLEPQVGWNLTTGERHVPSVGHDVIGRQEVPHQSIGLQPKNFPRALGISATAISPSATFSGVKHGATRPTKKLVATQKSTGQEWTRIGRQVSRTEYRTPIWQGSCNGKESFYTSTVRHTALRIINISSIHTSGFT